MDLVFLFSDSWVRSIVRFLRGLGFFAPFLTEALDSSFFYIPLGTELLLIGLISAHHDSLMWLIYPVMAAAGTTVGVSLLDLVTRWGGEEGLERFVKPERVEWLKSKLEGRVGWVLLIASMLPPPVPFRATVMTASALQSPRSQMLPAIFGGRLVRYSVESVLIYYFGRRLLAFLNSDVIDYIVYAMIAVAIVGSIVLFYKWFVSK
ncbi:MAG: hypothetical protein MSG64_17790 [Pyrinomonadaceae bacterium MAG19_C2-C3]|nr:hypothetical protein [Pyrinomonadaceae bacterium MAG19_C2-C3]